MSGVKPNSLRERVMTQVHFGPGCWEWTGYKWPNGYGAIRSGKGKSRYAHRVVYELWVGPVPEGLQLDHLCRNKACVNPTHLEPVTQRENLLRGDTVVAAHACKTHCPQGHLYDEANTYLYRGRRQCRACRCATAKRHYKNQGMGDGGNR